MDFVVNETSMRILHIVNPVKVDPTSDLYVAQPVTFESMRVARSQIDVDLQVDFMACVYEEDLDMVPEFFEHTTILDRSVSDLADFRRPRALPLIQDLIGSSGGVSFDYLIYTNVDIALLPWFYSVVRQRISNELDAFVINRRTISDAVTSPLELESMYAQVGMKHPGMDCFIMSKDIVEKLYLADTCIGATFIGKAIEINLLTHAVSYEHFKEDHLTFHIGDDRSWKSTELNDYGEYNKREFKKVIDHLLPIAQEHGRENALVRIDTYLNRIYDEPGSIRKSAPEENSSDTASIRQKIKQRIDVFRRNS